MKCWARVAKIPNGKTIDLAIASGDHEVQLRSGLMKSKPFPISVCPGERVAIRASLNSAFDTTSPGVAMRTDLGELLRP